VDACVLEAHGRDGELLEILERQVGCPGNTAERRRDRALRRRRGEALPHGFLLLVDDRQLTELDQEALLRPGSEVTFLRLLPLVGG
jgi:hypothetical protein